MTNGLFVRLRRDAGEAWVAYVGHPFVAALGAGTLPQAAFRRYLTQDYLFLIQFARAYALAAYKATNVADLRTAGAGMTAILDTEMPLHVSFCAGWGLSEAAMQAQPEALETIAYTRFVLERGLAGDLLDLHVALAPCVIGYAEIGARLAGQVAANPYAAWIETYAGEDYAKAAQAEQETLERLGRERGADARYTELLATFVAAVRLETAFWEMGMAADRADG
jgi:thiaminase (transcriptional activator TenA)